MLKRFPLMVNDATHKDMRELTESLDAFGHTEVVRRAVRFYYYYLTTSTTFNAVGLQENGKHDEYDKAAFIRLDIMLSEKTRKLLDRIKETMLIETKAAVIRIAVIRYNQAIKEGRVLA